MDAAIDIRGVTKTFGEKVAVDDLDLVVPTGSLCGFLGPNGAGKSTTIRMIMSIYFPDKGEISVLGRKSAVESKDRIGYLPEERGIYRKMRVGEFLIYMARLKGVDKAEARKRAAEWLERVALPDVIRKRCEELSKGMQQKVQIVAALIHDPELIILDEPFSGLDPVNSMLLQRLIHDLNDQGRTIIFSTHVLFQAEQICNRIFLIHRGRKVLDDTMEGIRQRFDPRTILLRTRGEHNGFDPRVVSGVRKVEERKGDLEVYLDEDTDPIETMRQMMNLADLEKIELRKPTLEDVFVRLVEDARISESGEVEIVEHAH
ncbi:MAG: ATP-binding cassette domain-containing protein [Phycisphaerales bacterium]|nr:ATP-binding cassette domain-containing protein [Phycisphaerales bacterium]